MIQTFGDRVDFAAPSTTLPGVVRHFKRFSDAAKENGLSRVYGGIHFLHAVNDGYQQGKSIGSAVSQLLPPLQR